MKIILVNKCLTCPYLEIIRDNYYRVDNEYLCMKRKMRIIVSDKFPDWCPLEDKE